MELHRAFKHFSEGHRCVTLTGTCGSGKSALASRLAAHLKPRHLFSRILRLDLSPDSEVLAAVREHAEAAQALAAVAHAQALEQHQLELQRSRRHHSSDDVDRDHRQSAAHSTRAPPPPPPLPPPQRPPTPAEELRRSLCWVIEEALASGQATANAASSRANGRRQRAASSATRSSGSSSSSSSIAAASGRDPEEPRWSRPLAPSVAELRDLIEELVAWCSQHLTASSSSSSSTSLDQWRGSYSELPPQRLGLPRSASSPQTDSSGRGSGGGGGGLSLRSSQSADGLTAAAPPPPSLLSSSATAEDVASAAASARVAALEAGAAQIHEVWRRQRRTMGPYSNSSSSSGSGSGSGTPGAAASSNDAAPLPPAWRTIEAAEYPGWWASLQESKAHGPETLAAIHKFLPASPHDPNSPDLLCAEPPPPSDDDDGSSSSRMEVKKVHWVNIDVPYALLPESWKDKNRMYVVLPPPPTTLLTANSGNGGRRDGRGSPTSLDPARNTTSLEPSAGQDPLPALIRRAWSLPEDNADETLHGDWPDVMLGTHEMRHESEPSFSQHSSSSAGSRSSHGSHNGSGSGGDSPRQHYLSAPQRPLLLVVDGADAWCAPLVELLNRLFQKCQLVRVLSTCCTGLAATSCRWTGGADGGFAQVVAAPELEAEPEKQIWVGKLKAAEAAELLVLSAPRNLMLHEMGRSVSGQQALSWDASMKLLGAQPALDALKGHPRAIRRFVTYLGALEDSNNSSGDTDGRNSNHRGSSSSSSLQPLRKLNDLVETARECYHATTARDRTLGGSGFSALQSAAGGGDAQPPLPLPSSSSLSSQTAGKPSSTVAESEAAAAAAAAAARLEHDPLSALLWARAVAGIDTQTTNNNNNSSDVVKPVNAAAMYSRDAVWQAAPPGSGSGSGGGGIGLTAALEADLHAASLSLNASPVANNNSSNHHGVAAVRRFSASDVSFLQQMVGMARAAGKKQAAASQRGGGGHGHSYREGNGHQTCSYDDFVHFTRWWAPLRGVVAWLGADWRKTGTELLVHGFLTRVAANQKLQGLAPGTFLLRFSESKPGKLVVAFNDRPRSAPEAPRGATVATGGARGGAGATTRITPPLTSSQPLSVAPLSLAQSPPPQQHIDGANPQAGDVGRDHASSAAGSTTTSSRATTTSTATTAATLVINHCLVDVRGGCCAITFEEGLRQEYSTLAALVLDCRRLEFIEPHVPKAQAFRSDARGGSSWNHHSGLQGIGIGDNSGHASANQQQRPEPLDDFRVPDNLPGGGHEPFSQ